MPQISSAPPGWFVKVVNKVIEGLAQVAAYLDDVIASNLIRRPTSRRYDPASNASANTTLSFPPPRLASAPRMHFFLATPFRPRVSAQMRKKFRL